MANYENLKSAIQQVVKTNGNNAITGALLQQSLLAMINSLGAGYQFIGVATPATNPGTPDKKVFYIASTAGTYSDFGGLEVTEDEVVVLTWDSSWRKAQIWTTNVIRPLLDGKQDTISDLDAIRQGAEKGSTALQSESDPVYTADKPNLALKSELDGKVDKEDGKVLSSNDYTDAEKAKLAGLENYDDAQIRALIDGKQDTIPDLADIRSNAAKGATALQSETDPVYSADKPNIALKTEIPDVSGKADKATTLAGYGIGDAYTKSEVDAGLAAKQDALTLTVKDNGNIVLANIQGQSKEFMPATPSGDPMHYAYEAAGAEYNDTGADITKTAPWADMVDDEADAIVTHKAGYWYLNGLGDISTAELKHLAMFDQCKYELLGKYTITYLLDNCKSRTFFNRNDRYLLGYMQAAIFSSNIVVVRISEGSNSSDGYKVRDLASFCSISSSPLRHILGDVNCADKDLKIDISSFSGSNIMTIKMKYLHQNIWFNNTKILTCKSILYMIQNEAATSAITITLHADVYAKAMANADIVAALGAHPNVSLASA